jgi:hypothetical protein
MHGGAQSIHVVNQQVHCYRMVPPLRKAVGKPSVSCAQIQNFETIMLQVFKRGKDVSLKVAKRASANSPLRLILAGDVAIRQRRVILVNVTATPLFLPHNLVFLNETLEPGLTDRWKRIPNSVITAQAEEAFRARQDGVYLWSNLWEITQ